MRYGWLLTVLALGACEPDRGVRLVYSSGGDSLGVVEARLKRVKAKYRLERRDRGFVLTLPGADAKAATQAKELLGLPGVLELSFVVEGQAKLRDGAQLPEGVTLTDERYAPQPSSHLEGPTRRTVEDALPLVELPKGRVLVAPEETHFRTWVLDGKPVLGNEAVESAEASTNRQTQEPEVNLSFTAAGATAFADATGKGVGRRIAILLDGRVQSAPLVQERIAGGHARITLGHAKPTGDLAAEARLLALTLGAGALPEAPVLASEEAYGAK